MPTASLIEPLLAPQSGYLKTVNARVVGETSVALGAGRAKKEDSIDLAVGIIVHHKVGDKVEKDQPIFSIHANDQSKLDEAKENLLTSLSFSEQSVDPLPLFYDIVK